MRRGMILTLTTALVAGCGATPTGVAPGAQLLNQRTVSKASMQVHARALVRDKSVKLAATRLVVQGTGFTDGQLPVPGAKIKDSFMGYQVHELPAGMKLDKALETYYTDSRVVSAQPLVLHAATEASASVPSLGGATHDPDLFQQWWLDKIHAPQAWQLTRGLPEVVVAVLDTGVDYRHEDLAANVINGPDFAGGDSDSLDEGGHGTHVAGIIAASGDNSRGGSGVAPGAKVLALKVFKPYYENNEYQGFYADDFDIARAIYYAATHEAKIINMSLGGHGIAPIIQSVCDDAVGRGVVIFAAAGNDHENSLEDMSPAGIESVIPVVATDPMDRLTGFSNWGRMDAVAAPGGNIYSTVPSYQAKYGHKLPLNYTFMDGTSMACPVAAGEAALVTSILLTKVREFFSSRKIELEVKAADLPAEEIANAVRYGSVDLGAYDRDTTFGYGRIDALAAVKRASDPGTVKTVANKVYRKLMTQP